MLAPKVGRCVVLILCAVMVGSVSRGTTRASHFEEKTQFAPHKASLMRLVKHFRQTEWALYARFFTKSQRRLATALAGLQTRQMFAKRRFRIDLVNKRCSECVYHHLVAPYSHTSCPLVGSPRFTKRLSRAVTLHHYAR